MNAAVRTTCPYCGVGCGVLARPSTSGAIEITGDREHPANFGRLCSKGAALGDTVDAEGRLLHPLIRGQRVSWEEVLTHVAEGFNRAIRKHGPDSVAFYVSGQLLTEDYYVANKLMKGFIGSANIDTNSRLCMASAVAGHTRAFGEDLVPGCYEDLELADLIVLVGSNLAWCHPVLFQRICEAKERRRGLKLVVIDPRRTPTCEMADLHLPIKCGTDVWLFNGLLSFLHRSGATDAAFVDAHTTGAASALQVAEASAGELSTTAKICGIDAGRIGEFYQLFAATERVVTAFSQGVNQSSAGTNKVNAIINCHLLTGRIGRPGMGAFSLTGQPNAMGGREVGGMANLLAAHMTLDNAEHRGLVQEFWRAPRVATRPGLKAVELFEAMHAKTIKAVWIMATNPVVSLPDADRVREALERCELVVVSDCVGVTDTTALAHVLLPAAAWGEKDGTVTNSERRISRQRAFLPPPGEAQPDWWIVCEVAKRMGFVQGFSYDSPHAIFDEHARLTSLGNDGSRRFDIRALAGLTDAAYDELEPVQWPLPHPGVAGVSRLFEDGRFPRPDGKARFIPTAPRAPVNALDEAFPLALNTGRIRDQWHTMTRTSRSGRLTEHLPEPFVDLHAEDALRAGVREGELARIFTHWGSMVARVRSSGELARGDIFVPIHWSSPHASDARVGALVNPVVDALSGEPEFKHTPSRIEPFDVKWYGFILTRAPLAALDATWWTLVRGGELLRYEMAGREIPSDWAGWARERLGATDPAADYLDYEDPAAGIYRAAYLIDDRLAAALYVSSRPEFPGRQWLASLIGGAPLQHSERTRLLAGQPARGAEDAGPLVCSCFGLGRDTLRKAIAKYALTSAQQVGDRLRAGTSCGSCLPEILAVISAAASETR